jgi:hypothetical protein
VAPRVLRVPPQSGSLRAMGSKTSSRRRRTHLKAHEARKERAREGVPESGGGGSKTENRRGRHT